MSLYFENQIKCFKNEKLFCTEGAKKENTLSQSSEMNFEIESQLLLFIITVFFLFLKLIILKLLVVYPTKYPSFFKKDMTKHIMIS